MQRARTCPEYSEDLSHPLDMYLPIGSYSSSQAMDIPTRQTTLDTLFRLMQRIQVCRQRISMIKHFRSRLSKYGLRRLSQSMRYSSSTAAFQVEYLPLRVRFLAPKIEGSLTPSDGDISAT